MAGRMPVYIQNSADVRELARILADWADGGPGFRPIYLFGSRVRGDHHPGSDLDVRMFPENYDGDDPSSEWWDRENASDFAGLKSLLPGPLDLHCDATDDADAAIRSAASHLVYVDRGIVCVWTPPKSRPDL